jgi:hypothetical protein
MQREYYAPTRLLKTHAVAVLFVGKLSVGCASTVA